MAFIKLKDSPKVLVNTEDINRIQSFVDAGVIKVRVTVGNEEFVFPFGSDTALNNWLGDLGNLTPVLDWADYNA